MTAVGELMLLVLGLMVTAHCEVRARDPEVEEEDQGLPVERGGWDTQGVGVHPGPGKFDIPHLRNGPHGHRPDIPGSAHHPVRHGPHGQPHQAGSGQHPLGLLPKETAPPPGEGGSYPARTGNWCAFVHRRIESIVESCGTEKYTIKSQSPCPNGTPDCQLVMYKLSTRPVYREKQKIFTALLWRCCPGHGGENCEETVADGHVSDPADPTVAGRPHSGDTEPHHTGAQSRLTHQAEREQNDFQVSENPLYELHASEADNNNKHTESRESPSYPRQAQEHIPHHGYDPPHNPNHHQRDFNHGDPIRDEVEAVPLLPYQDSQSPPLLHMMALLMSQLQPMLDGFNRTLEHLTQEVEGLSRDVALLRNSQWEVEEEAQRGAGAGEGPEALEAKLEQGFQDTKEVRRELERQRAEMADRLHSQHAMLHYNITNFKTDIDGKIKRNHKMLQVNLQSMNATLSDMKLEQDRLSEVLQRHLTSPGARREPSQVDPSQAQQPPKDSAVWEAIARLDNKVVNNTVRVNALVEDLEMANDNVLDLKRGFRGLEENIAQTGRNSQIQFMETGLEVEAAKVAVLNRVNELANNLTIHSEQLQEMETDMDYLYTQFYQNVSAAGDCDCKAFTASFSRLEQGLTNVTELANDNRLALDGGTDAESAHWGPSVDDVMASLAFEQEKSRTLQHNLTQLMTSVLGSHRDVLSLQESDKRLAAEMRHLSSSFYSLLKDAIRHTEVLEMLLGEEVMGFMDWPLHEQEAHSIPALQKRLQHMQQQIRGQNLSLTTLLEAARAEEVPSSDEPSVLVDLASRGLKRRSGDQRSDHLMDSAASEDRQDYSDSDLLSLEKAVEELGEKVNRLEYRPCPASCNITKDSASGGVEAKMQVEVAWLRKGLENHLRLFKNVFSNSEGLAESESTLDLDQLWALMKRKERKRQRKRKDKKEGIKDHIGESANLRSRRDTSVLSKLRDSPLMFLARSIQRSRPSDSLLVSEDTSLNLGQMYSTHTGMFQAPLAGVYLFVLTLNFEPGPSLSGLRRENGELAATLHQDKMASYGPVTRVCLLQLRQGEELRLELLGGTLVTDDPNDNIFAGLLLHHTT
ncbi:multimerin-2-like isoform X1 [Salvelinus namaycush]|uniref:Multimerin-2-like isoform X1 n=1 Tax=Salvelinus namaycush TaxID=8040 RepID=A0A8U0P182_SALNM|nr:multimerin-2-like isoform X1 [Salvelinus namaycush]